MNRIDVYFSLGSNIEPKSENLKKAVRLMSEKFGISPKAVSETIETDPVGFISEDRFMNMAVCFSFPQAGQSPALHCLSILSRCEQIEKQMGRKIKGEKYSPEGSRIYSSRNIDIDILLYGHDRISDPRLCVPHKEMYNREFVLVPLKQIASDEDIFIEDKK